MGESAILHYINPVSYTHLDGYKRQVIPKPLVAPVIEDVCQLFILIRPLVERFLDQLTGIYVLSVCIDVYKRQQLQPAQGENYFSP